MSLSWRVSNTLEAVAHFCVDALEEALSKGKPEVFNTDQGSQFTSEAFTGLLEQHGVRVSMEYQTPAEVFISNNHVVTQGNDVQSGNPLTSSEALGAAGPALNMAPILSN